MKLKICGLNNPDNLLDIVNLEPDFIGFIFYSKSKRYVANNISHEQLMLISKSVKKVGVFVNEDLDVVQRVYDQFNLDYVQLHGEENQDYCEKLHLMHVPLIKAFRISESFNFQTLNAYAPFCSFFLFDTAGVNPGGNGIKFNWKLIDNYDLKVPFFLSGGIGYNDINLISKLSFEMLYAIDINSQFEIKPGIKDVKKAKKFINKINLLNQRVI
jgi:phosphoribosylanthranilate isomerase